MDAERLDKWCAKGILGLILAILVYSPLATGAARPQDFLVVQWLTVAVLGLWGVRFLVNPKHRLLWAPVCWAVLLFVVYALLRYAQADVEYLARQELIRVLTYTALFYAVVTNLHKQNATQTVALTLIVLAALISMYAVAQFLTESNRVWHFIRPEIYNKRGSGTFICPNNLAGYLAMILPLGLAYTLTGRFDHVTKIIIGYCSLVSFAGLAVTVSRAGWLAAALTLMVLFFWLFRQRGYRLQAVVLVVALAAIGTVFFLKADFSKNRSNSLRATVDAEDIRFRLWPPTIQMWQDHLWWGVGPAHFDYRFRQYRPADDQLQNRPVRVHNDYLNTLVDWGLVGAGLVAVIWLLFYWEVFRSWKYVQRSPNDLTTKRSNKASLVMGASLGLFATLVHSIFDFNMHVPANALLAVTLMALVVGHFRFATERWWVTLRWPLRTGVLLVLIALLGYLAGQAWRQTRQSYWLLAAEARDRSPAERLQALQQAFAAEPRNFETAYRLGETYRLESWDGGANHRGFAEAALPWYERAAALNPYDPYSLLRHGMTLDWLDRPEEALPYFETARRLDPNNYYVLALVGWHHVQAAEAAPTPATKQAQYEKALARFEQSLSLQWTTNNTIARSYYHIAKARLAELTPLNSSPEMD